MAFCKTLWRSRFTRFCARQHQTGAQFELHNPIANCLPPAGGSELRRRETPLLAQFTSPPMDHDDATRHT